MKLAEAHLRRKSWKLDNHIRWLIGQATVSRRLSVQTEPVSRDIAVIVPDVEIVCILAHRPGPRDSLLAIVTATKA